MNTEIKKLTRSIYLTIIVVALALVVLFWFVSHSFVKIEIEPRNAKLMIDGNTVNSTSAGIFSRFVSPGLHVVKIESPNYIGMSQEVNFKRGLAKKLKVTLKKLDNPFVISERGEFLSKGNDFNDIYYLEGETFYRVRVKADGTEGVKLFEKRDITAPNISDTSEVVWSPTKELALLRKTEQVNLFDFKKYDFVNQTEELWGKSIGSIAWSPDNSKVAYYYAPPSGEKSLIFSNLTNKEVSRVLNFSDLGINNPLLRWSPDSEWLLIIPRNDNAEENKIYLFNAYSRSMTEIADTGNNLDASFSPDGNKIIYSIYSKDSKGPVNSILSVMDRDGSNKRSLGIRAELRKVLWVKDSVNIVLASYDYASQSESIYMFDTIKKQQNGFIIKNLGDAFVQNLALTDDGKVVIYQENDGIKAISVD